MVKVLTFKGDKKLKKQKRKRNIVEDENRGQQDSHSELIVSTSSIVEEDDSWVTADALEDITGPAIILLSTSPTTCLASDANGKIFASAVENLIEGERETAEPHDVRQVWVATNVAGTQALTFKGHHGKYLGCNRSGILSATKEAISPEESFHIIALSASPATFALRTNGKFVTVEENNDTTHVELRGDAEVTGPLSSLCIRVQARFRPRSKTLKDEKIKEKVKRLELEEAVGRRLAEDEVKKLKKARREGSYREALLDMKVKGKHDKFA